VRILIFVCDRCGARDERKIVGNKTSAPPDWRTFALSQVLKEPPYQRVFGRIHCCPACAAWDGVEASTEPLQLAGKKAGAK